jgi:hypothetical protein
LARLFKTSQEDVFCFAKSSLEGDGKTLRTSERRRIIVKNTFYGLVECHFNKYKNSDMCGW